jgi:hypothetical protein
MKSAGMAALCTVAVALAAACASHGRNAGSPAAPPEVVTVPRLKSELQAGEGTDVLIAEIERSGTVYRLTPEQRADLQNAGMPGSIMGIMQNTYDHAIRKNPALATSNEHWMKIGDYWYGGLPAGWPRDWVVGAPAPGQILR